MTRVDAIATEASTHCKILQEVPAAHSNRLAPLHLPPTPCDASFRKHWPVPTHTILSPGSEFMGLMVWVASPLALSLNNMPAVWQIILAADHDRLCSKRTLASNRSRTLLENDRAQVCPSPLHGPHRNHWCWKVSGMWCQECTGSCLTSVTAIGQGHGADHAPMAH